MVPRTSKGHDRIWGKIAEFCFFFVLLLAVFVIIFIGGNWISGLVEGLSGEYIKPIFDALGTLPIPYMEIAMRGLYTGLVLGLGLVISYIFLFYFMFSMLEESNFVARVSQDANEVFKKIGLSGRATIPLLLGYGCTIPAVLGTRVAKTRTEKIAIGFLSLLLPCVARTSVILALIGAFLGPHMAMMVYLINAIVVLLAGVGMSRLLGLKQASQQIFSRPEYRMPNLRMALSHAYYETLEFVQMTIPWIAIGTMGVEFLTEFGILDQAGSLAKPILETLFGLPGIVFLPLVFGVIRGELALAMLAVVGGTTDFSRILSPKQMIVFSIISMMYIPCLATIAALVKEFGKRDAGIILAANLLMTIVIGILANAVLSLIIS